VLAHGRGGSIVLLHDGLDGNPHANRTVLLRAMPLILAGLRAMAHVGQGQPGPRLAEQPTQGQRVMVVRRVVIGDDRVGIQAAPCRQPRGFRRASARAWQWPSISANKVGHP
jgi:hypothetical protein